MLLRQLSPFLNLFLTSPCPLCDRPGKPLLCQDCSQQLQDCHSKTQDLGRIHSNPAEPDIISWGAYKGTIKRAIAQLKYHNSPALAEPMGEGLAKAWLQSQPANHQAPFPSSVPRSRQPWVVPVPMHPDKQRQRGFNQAELIARSFCRHTGLPLLAQGLQRIQATQAQFELSPAERQRNVAQAFALGPGLQRKRHRPVLLLDDIYTTGATVRAIAQVLEAAQIPCTGVAVVARAIL